MNSPIPDTRNSLILRLPDNQDTEAWEQFITIYEPLVFRLARAKGFQDADAREIVQEVMVAVAGAVERWQPDPELGRFRDWLFRIARNLMIKFVTRRKYRSIGSGREEVADLLNQHVDPNSDEATEFNLEYRREVFRLAAESVRQQVSDSTWQAFWQTSIEGKPVDAVANAIGMSTGSIHVARSRVRGRLRQAVQRLEFRSD